jgi:cytochrome c556
MTSNRVRRSHAELEPWDKEESMRKIAMAIGVSVLLGGALSMVSAHMKDEELPAGPIRDRHILMEGIGKNAKIIGDALKAGTNNGIEEAAGKITASAAKIVPMFPKSSTDPKSRAKPEIWTHWQKFQDTAKELQTTAGVLVDTAHNGGDVKTAANRMFGACKTCHDEFRVPEKKEKK